MAIKVSQAFERTSANPIDVTLALTQAQMLTVNDNLMPDYYFTICQDDGYIYLYDKNATASATTGKFKKFEGSGGGGGGTAGSIYTGTLTVAGWNSTTNRQTVTFTDYDDSYNGVVGVPSNATDAQRTAYAEAKIHVVSQSGTDVVFEAETIPTIALPVAIYCGGGSGSGVPDGGTTGQALVKKSNTDGDVEWSTINSIPTGGTTGQVLAKKSNTDRDVEWKDDSAGHKILDTDATAMTQREKLQFTGLDVIDDSTNNKTEVKPFGLNSDDLDEIIDTSEISNGFIQSAFNYSTEEQVIGKWIDGRPLYQKTFSFTNITISSDTNTFVGDISGLNLETGWCSSAVFIESGRDYQEGLGYMAAWVRPVHNNLGVRIMLGSGISTTFIEAYITIQYTKTTD